ncbi:MAG: metallophosphoesterase, partial [Nitrososphaeraceae archaeon]
EDYDLAAVGDVSCGAEGKKTLNAIGKTNPEFTIVLGDLAYKKNSPKCFSDATKSAGIKKTGCVIGNNDDRTSSATKAALKFCSLPTSGYKSLKFKGDLYILMNSEKSFKKDSSQYNFVLSELKSDAAKNARYIIVIIHNPFLSCQCSHDAREFSTYHSIFSTYGVDLVLQAHNHNVQYYKVDSIIYQVSGAGGRSHYPLGPTPKPTFFQNDNLYGFSAIKLTDDDINGTFYSNNGKAVSGSDFSMNQKKGSSADSATLPRSPF